MDMQQILQRIEELLNVGLGEQPFKNYLRMVITLLIDMLRQIEGDEFCQGFLQGAINSIKAGDKPLIKMKEIKTGAIH